LKKMEKKLVALVLIALISGLGGGYGLGYVIYQPQIESIEKDLSIIQQNLNRTWHMTYNIATDTDISTRIHFKGDSVRVMWIAYGFGEYAQVAIYLDFTNGTPFAVWGFSGRFTANNAILELPQSGSYDLVIVAIDTDYQVSVWDYY